MSYEQYRNVLNSFDVGSGRRREAERDRRSDLESRIDSGAAIKAKIREKLDQRIADSKTDFQKAIAKRQSKLLKDIGISEDVQERTQSIGTAINTAYPGIVVAGRSGKKIAGRLRQKLEGAKSDVAQPKSLSPDTKEPTSAPQGENEGVELTEMDTKNPGKPKGLQSMDTPENTYSSNLADTDADNMMVGQEAETGVEDAAKAGTRAAVKEGTEAAADVAADVGESTAAGVGEAAGLGIAEAIPGLDVIAGLGLGIYEIGNLFHAWGKGDNFGQGDDAAKQVQEDEAAPPPKPKPIEKQPVVGIVNPSRLSAGRVSTLAGSSGVASVVSSQLK